MPPFPLTANYCTVSLALSFSFGPPAWLLLLLFPRGLLCTVPPQVVCGGLASRLRHWRKHPVVSAVAYHTLRGKCASGQTGVPTPLLSSFGQPIALSLLYFAWAFLLLLFVFGGSVPLYPPVRVYVTYSISTIESYPSSQEREREKGGRWQCHS